MIHRFSRIFSLAILGMMAFPHSAAAEVVFEYRPRWALTETAVKFRHFKSEVGDSSSTISQFSAPVQISSPLTRNLDVSAFFWIVNSSLDVNGGAQPQAGVSLGGITDIKARGNYRFLRNHAMFGVGLNVPTGKTKFSAEEDILWNAISNRLFGFDVRYMGEGWNVDLNLVGAHDFSPRLVLGGGVAYQIKGEFELSSVQTVNYRPGNELNLSLGLSYGGESTSWRLEGAYRNFGTDQRDDGAGFEDELKEGSQIEVAGNVTKVTGVGKFSVSAANIFKDDTEFLQAGITTSSFKNLNGNIFFMGVDYTRVLNQRMDGFLKIAGSIFGENSLGEGDGNVWDLGAGARLKLGSALIGSASLDYLFGSAEDGTVDLTGFDLSAGISFNY